MHRTQDRMAEIPKVNPRLVPWAPCLEEILLCVEVPIFAKTSYQIVQAYLKKEDRASSVPQKPRPTQVKCEVCYYPSSTVPIQ